MAGQNLGRPARRRRYRSSMPLRQSGKNSIVSSQRETGSLSFSYLIRRYCVRKNAGEPKLSPLLGRDSKISSQVSGSFGAAYKPNA
jgi:hypothetical protein